ncbi:hypothetical protein QJS10_CPB04g01444 [Acorus calamus]|uniref:Uncharacterized protein n=1 Tax=Acorus calamus TaxID=4465 RepID=A0AAV9F3V1_ACOCL|nr:hypothetical protein QJS10_CPB04g01444 [Acorus calamus]
MKRRGKPRSTAEPLRGVLTRSKSEIFLHRTRSGLSRPDLRHPIKIPFSSLRNPKTSHPGFADDMCSSSIKDLRLKRVFSPLDSVSRDPDFYDVKIEDVLEIDTVEIGNGSGEEWIQSTPPDWDSLRESGVGRSDGGDATEDVDRVAEIPSSGIPADAVKVAFEIDVGEDGNDPGEERIQTSPPDWASFRESGLAGCDGGEVIKVVDTKIVDRVMEKGVPSRNTKVIKPHISCSRSKLFRNPNSFSYRRLLPYLMGLATDSSGTLETRPGQTIVEVSKGTTKCPIVDNLEGCVTEKDLDKPQDSQLCNPMETSMSSDPKSGRWSSVESELSCCLEMEMSFKKSFDNSTPVELYPLKSSPVASKALSFAERLCAQKATEFSKKQMKEAEEVATGLLKELSCFRNLMERSVSLVKGVESHTDILVKAICRRASKAEELAKNHLSQMANDCRITNLQKPRVTFADHVEEKIITKYEVENSELNGR